MSAFGATGMVNILSTAENIYFVLMLRLTYGYLPQTAYICRLTFWIAHVRKTKRA